MHTFQIAEPVLDGYKNEKLKDENIHLNTELEVAKHIQTLVLPQKEEYSSFKDLDISCRMIPAA